MPQGFNDSVDAFGYLTDDIVKDVQCTVKSVDDILGQCRTLQEVYDTLAEVLYRVILKNMVVCPEKFKLGQIITYGGFVLETKNNVPIKILPDGSRLEELLNLIPTTSKPELHSFLGLINTFKIWCPAISPHTPYLRSLAKKDALFRLTPEAQSNLIRLKRIYLLR